jgi:acyl-coenzyme A thioesterase PaaI-like protein
MEIDGSVALMTGAVGLTNTTHLLRSGTSGTVTGEAVGLNQGRTQQLWRVDTSSDAPTACPRRGSLPQRRRAGALTN